MVVKLIDTGWFTHQEKILWFVFLVGFLQIGRIVEVIQKLVASVFDKGTHKIEKHEKSKSHKQAEKYFFLTKFRLLNERTVLDGLVKADGGCCWLLLFN